MTPVPVLPVLNTGKIIATLNEYGVKYVIAYLAKLLGDILDQKEYMGLSV